MCKMKKIFLLIPIALISAFLAFRVVLAQFSPSSIPKTAQVTQIQTPLPTPSPEVVFSNPGQLTIPKINVSATVEEVGLDSEKKMDVPKLNENVGWYMYGAKPGEAGNAVFAGHLDTSSGGAAVFYNLDRIAIGDAIQVTDTSGNTLTYEVYRVSIFEDRSFPLDLVFGPNNESNVILITCEGVFDRTERNYTDRLVVFSRLVK